MGLFKLCTLTLIASIGFSSICSAQTKTVVTVGIEDAGFTAEVGKDLTVRMFKMMEEIGDLKFVIKKMNYMRACSDLKNGKIDVLLYTPFGCETPEFYESAQELKWNIPTKTDYFAKDPSKLSNLKDMSKMRIGIPKGNEDFAAELLCVPKSQFVPNSSLPSLVKLLNKGRIDAIWFERGSVMRAIKSAGVKGLSHSRFPLEGPPLGVGRQKNAKGNALKVKLDGLIKKIDTKKLFESYYKFYNMEDKGVVK